MTPRFVRTLQGLVRAGAPGPVSRLRNSLILSAICLSAAPAPAQLLDRVSPGVVNASTPSIVITPWLDDAHWAQSLDEILVFEKGYTKGGDEDTSLWYWDSNGRIKFEREDSEPVFSLGYSILTFEIESENRLLDGQLNDLSLVGTGNFGKLIEEWEVSLTGGLGNANDGHWRNSDALYGVAAVNFARALSETEKIHIGLSYWGSRPLWPDIPLPYASYVARVSDQLEYVVGLPDTKIVYKPVDRLTLNAGFSFTTDAWVQTTFEIGAGFNVYGQFTRSVDGFYIDGVDNRRLFHEIDRVSAGVRWISDWLDISLGVGYALDQEFRAGHDIRDLEDVGDLNSRVFVALKIQGAI